MLHTIFPEAFQRVLIPRHELLGRLTQQGDHSCDMKVGMVGFVVKPDASE